MKKSILTFILLLVIPASLIAQSKAEQKAEAEAKKLRDKIYNSGDKDFDISVAPEKYKNEPAVILCQKLTQVFDKSGVDMVISNSKSLETSEILRKRIKLQDKSAVQAFSEFYFKSTNEIGVRIIKPDGKFTDVNMKDAVEVSNSVNIPSFYRSYYSFSYKYKKIAIPDLQPGDIIDYFYTISETYFIPGYPSFTFNDVIISLSNTYPTLKQKIEFKVEKQFYINIKSLNGAPNLTPQAAKEENFFVYTLELKDSDKYFDERWVYPYRSTPTIKYQVFFLRSEGTYTKYSLGERGKPKTSITPDEAVDQIRKVYEDAMAMSYDNIVNDYISEKMGKETNPEKVSAEAYYYLRGLLSTPSITGSYPGYLDQSYESVLKSLSDIDLYGPANERMNDEIFTRTLANVLKKRKIPFRIAFAVPRHIGQLEDAILANEFLWSIYVDASKPFFLFAPSYASHPKEIDYRMEGVDAYVILPKNDSKAKKYEIKKVPVSTSAENNTHEKLQVNLDDGMELASIERNIIVKGKNKDVYFESTIIQADYADEEMKRYNLKPRYIYKGKKDKMALIDKAVISAREEAIKKRSDSQKAELEDNGFEIESYDSFILANDGRQPGKTEVNFSEKFKVKNIIKRAGPTYILEAGKLIGSQLQVKEDEMTRHYDVYMNFPRSFTYEISITIPEGYKIEGSEKLNMNVDNSTGTFKSTSKIEGGKLVLNVSKSYKNNFEKKESWNDMVKFLDEAYKFTQSKVVLKKA